MDIAHIDRQCSIVMASDNRQIPKNTIDNAP